MRVTWVGPLLLCREEVDRVPVRIPGIYLLHTFDAHRGFYPPLYVGKTHDLHERLSQHLVSVSTTPEIQLLRSRIRMYFSAAPVTERAVRDAVEAALIHLLRPPCNRQVPRVPPLYTNLPLMALGF